MSDQNLDRAALRRTVEQGVSREKWLYRILFFAMHALFFVVSMLIAWGTVVANEQLRMLLFSSGSGASIILVLPTVLWAAVLLFHGAALYTESGIAEKAMRERILMRELREDVLRQAYEDPGGLEKLKRRTTLSDARRILASDDGELPPAEDDRAEQPENAVRVNQSGSW